MKRSESLEYQRFSPNSAGRYRVDNVPSLIRPVYTAIAWALGAALYTYYFVCRVTSRIVVRGPGPGDGDLSQHAIYCLWHESWWPYFVVFLRFRGPHVLITDPAAYMKPVHTVFRMMGCRRLILGSSGEEGRNAANEAAALIRNGWSSTISPDGPHGPARIFKKGVLHMALQSGAPIVPLALSSRRYIPWSSWDSKKFPLPFNQITVRVHEKIFVTQHNFDTAAERIISSLAS
jgi:lysophospholipid acyltransferase (LPLAT)-like uncharacterized protein